jgi:hypothetical protein
MVGLSCHALHAIGDRSVVKPVSFASTTLHSDETSWCHGYAQMHECKRFNHQLCNGAGTLTIGVVLSTAVA